MNKQDLSKVSVEEVGFSMETIVALKKNKLLTMGALTFMAPEDLLYGYNLKQESVTEIEKKLNEYGSRLRTEAENTMDNFYEDCMFGIDGPLWREPKQKGSNETAKITREDIVNLYKERYFNEKNIKKYATPDEKKIRQVVSNIKEEYLDFVYNIIISNDIQFSIDRTQHCVCAEPDANGVIKTKVFASIDESDGSTFFHELGHAASLCKCFDSSEGCYDLLRTATISEKTLAEVLKHELSNNKDKVKQMVLESHRQCVEPVFGQDKYQSIERNSDFLKEFKKVERSIGGLCGFILPSSKNRDKTAANRAKYNEMFKKICDEGIVATRNSLEHNEAHKKFRHDNEAILDVLSSVYDMDYPYDLQIHTRKYYESCPEHQVGELWANLFALKVTGREDLLYEFSRYLPDTFYAFKHVFDRVKEFYQLRACFAK